MARPDVAGGAGPRRRRQGGARRERWAGTAALGHRPAICLRVEFDQDGLNDLLEASVVETIRTPPVPLLDFRDWRNLAVTDLQLQHNTGSTVGVLDDAPESEHPAAGRSGAVRGRPGTRRLPVAAARLPRHEVIGRILYPAPHEQLRDLAPPTSVSAVRVVRMEPEPDGGPGATRFATCHGRAGDPTPPRRAPGENVQPVA